MTTLENMIDLTSEELESGMADCEASIKDLKMRIVSEYEIIKPVLTRMRDMKRELHRLKDKRETLKTFLSIERNGTLSSISSLDSIKPELAVRESREPVTLHDIIQDIDGGKLDSDSDGQKTPRARDVRNDPESRKIPLEWLMPKRDPKADRPSESKTLPRMKSPKTPTKSRNASSAELPSAIPVLKRNALR